MDLGFNGASAVVTGGSKGMGLAVAETLGAEGASVAIVEPLDDQRTNGPIVARS